MVLSPDHVHDSTVDDPRGPDVHYTATRCDPAAHGPDFISSFYLPTAIHVKRLRGGLVYKAHRIVYDSTSG